MRRALTSIGMLLVLLASPVYAQQSAGDARELIALVAAEQQHIRDLEAELQRRSAVLADISERLSRIQPAGTVASAPAAAPPPAAVVAPAPDARPAMQVYGDILTRLSTLHQDYEGCVDCPHRTIGRFRLRLGVQSELPMGFQASMGIASGELNDPNSVYQTFGGNLSRKVVSWDRAFITYRPRRASWLELSAGKFAYPWTRSSMTFDVDFYPEGASERTSFTFRNGPLKRITAQAFQVVVNEQASGPDMRVLGGQASGTLQIGRLSTRMVTTAMTITQPELLLRSQLLGANVGVRNTNVIIGTGASARYASQFRYLNVMAENTLPTGRAAWPLTITAEWQRNLGAVGPDHTGWSLRADTGRNQRPGDWQLGYHFFRVGQEAILSGLGESDWRGPSNVLQQRIFAARTLHPQVQALVTWYRGRTLDTGAPGALLAPGLTAGMPDPWTNRWYFDMAYRFK